MIYQVLVTDYDKRTITQHGYEYGYKYSYYEFEDNGYTEYDVNDIVEKSGVYTYVPSQNTPYKCDSTLGDWEDVILEISDIQNEQYAKLDFKNTLYHFSPILVRKTDVNAIEEFYSRRNRERQQERRNISLYLDDNILDIAENLVNIIEQDIMLNNRIIAWGYSKYSYGNHKISIRDHEHKIFKDDFGLKGKEKKEVEKYNDELRRKIRDFSVIIDNFVEIIMEEKKLKDYVARAVAWEAIQRKTVEYYAQLWKEEYERHLERDFEELCEQMKKHDLDTIINEYISMVILCDEIDISYVREVLIYFLLSKTGYIDINLYDSFNKYKKIVGWQHTHPGYGIFLSNYDMFIQENFFNLPFQVAYVIDPVQHLRGFFQWKNGKVEKLKGFYIYDDVGKNIKIDVPKKINKDNDEKQADVIAIGKSQRIIQIGMAAVMLGLIIFSLSISRKYTNQVEKQRELEREIAYQNQMLSDQASEIDSIKISMNDKQEETAPSTEELLESTTEETTSVEDGKLDDTENATESTTQESSTEEENGGVYFKSYIVEPGDSLLAICNKQGIDYSSTYRIILSLNGIEDANAIYVGQTILLPIEK